MQIPTPTETTEVLARTIPGVRQATGLGTTMIYQLIKEGRLTKIKIGKRSLISEESLRRCLTDLAEKPQVAA